mmetsp:Transcript_32953/g.102152  ORF Transcript_32953/g.102152 Transcript_32953/m.102152 type:complete len:205 (-) Transcript_32953:2144-2758(-)
MADASTGLSGFWTSSASGDARTDASTFDTSTRCAARATRSACQAFRRGPISAFGFRSTCLTAAAPRCPKYPSRSKPSAWTSSADSGSFGPFAAAASVCARRFSKFNRFSVDFNFFSASSHRRSASRALSAARRAWPSASRRFPSSETASSLKWFMSSWTMRYASAGDHCDGSTSTLSVPSDSVMAARQPPRSSIIFESAAAVPS